jgi:hypothetical protein
LYTIQIQFCGGKIQIFIISKNSHHQFLSILFKNFIKYFNGITETFNSKQNDTALGFIKMVLTKNNKKQQ